MIDSTPCFYCFLLCCVWQKYHSSQWRVENTSVMWLVQIGFGCMNYKVKFRFSTLLYQNGNDRYIWLFWSHATIMSGPINWSTRLKPNFELQAWSTRIATITICVNFDQMSQYNTLEDQTEAKILNYMHGQQIMGVPIPSSLNKKTFDPIRPSYHINRSTLNCPIPLQFFFFPLSIIQLLGGDLNSKTLEGANKLNCKTLDHFYFFIFLNELDRQ